MTVLKPLDCGSGRTEEQEPWQKFKPLNRVTVWTGKRRKGKQRRTASQGKNTPGALAIHRFLGSKSFGGATKIPAVQTLWYSSLPKWTLLKLFLTILMRGPSNWFLDFLTQSQLLYDLFVCFQDRKKKKKVLDSYVSCLSSGINHLSEEPWLHLMENNIEKSWSGH